MSRYHSLLGIAAILGIAWLLSSHKGKFPVRVVLGGIVLQFLLALLILKTSVGRAVFEAIDTVFVSLLGCVDAGASFLFGEGFAEHFFAFRVLPTIIFFSALMSVLYYFGIIQKVVGLLAVVMQKTLGTSGAETLSAAANVFVGQTEAPLVIRPYIGTMTRSELNAVMIGGFATMAGGVLGALSAMGINAGHLLAASVISAPGALLIAKIMLPETEEPKTRGHVGVEVKDESVNVLEAIANGTTGGLQLALNVGAMLIVFLAMIALVNLLLGLAGDAFWHVAELSGRTVPDEPAKWSLEGLLGWAFYPIAWLIGIEPSDRGPAAQLLGLKMATNEFVAYGRLGEWAADGSAVTLTQRTRDLMTYALCGFANFSSIGIQLGGIGAMAPERRGDLAKLGLRAMIGGTLASFLTACIAAVLL